MSTGSFQINNIKIVTGAEGGNLTDTIGATVTYSVARISGTDIKIEVTVRTSQTGKKYSTLNSAYPIIAEIILNGSVLGNINVKSRVGSVLNKVGEGIFVKGMPVNATSANLIVRILHNNDMARSTAVPISFDLGYTNVSAPGEPVPTNKTTPWRNNTYEWSFQAATSGINNPVQAYEINYQIYNNGAWGDWKVAETINAAIATSIANAAAVTSAINYSKPRDFFKTIREGNRIRIAVRAIGRNGDISPWHNENPTWPASIAGAGQYQTQNTTPEGPTFETSSPISFDSPEIKLSSTHGSTNNYNGKVTTLKFGLGNTSSPKLYQSNASAPGEKKSYTFDVSNYMIPATKITLTGVVSDGWATGSSTKTYLCGARLSTPEIQLTALRDGFDLYVSDITVDNQRIPSTIDRTITIYIKYSNKSNFSVYKTLKNQNSSIVATMTKEDIFKVLGVPSSRDIRLQAYVTTSIPNYSIVKSVTVTSSFEWYSYPTPTISARDGFSTPYYRQGTSYPAAMNNITFSIISPKQTIEYRIGTTVIKNGTVYSLTGYSQEGKKTITCDVYEKYSNGSILLKKGLEIGSIYKIMQRREMIRNSAILQNGNNILQNGQIRIDLRSSLNYVIAGKIGIYFNDKMITELNYDNKDRDFYVTLNFSADNNGYKPSQGYKLINVNGNTVSEQAAVKIHDTNILEIKYRNLVEKYATVPSPSATDLKNGVSPTLYSNLTETSNKVELFAYASPIVNTKYTISTI